MTPEAESTATPAPTASRQPPSAAPADRWAIGIFLASSGQYTESELPASFGCKTGTPEEAVDDTFVLCAGPESGR